LARNSAARRSFRLTILSGLGSGTNRLSPVHFANLEHDPQKWIPVLRNDHAQTKE
jgi:hypothetical protein